jgi:hypothetical protein
MRSFKSVLLIGMVVGFLFTSSPARAQTSTCPLDDPSCSAGLTSLLVTIGIPVLVAGLILSLTWNTTSAPVARSAAAVVYLRQNHNELEQDLATGAGPLVNDLAATLELPADHVPALGALLKAHRGELREKATLKTLNPDRAVDFFRTLVELAKADPKLSGDLEALKSRHPLAM